MQKLWSVGHIGAGLVVILWLAGTAAAAGGQATATRDAAARGMVSQVGGARAQGAARPVTGYTIVAFSPDSTKWGYRTRFVRSVRPDQDGRFTLRGLPPDEYVLAAIEYVEPGQEHDPERLTAWSALGKKVTLGEGEAAVVTSKLIR